MKLLTLGNPKIEKGRKQGYLPAILHLAPADGAGSFERGGRTFAINVCPNATAGCRAACLNTAGRGGMPGKLGATIQAARIRKTREFFTDRADFMLRLEADIGAVIRKAERDGLIPCIRLNGTSDIRWEHVPFIAADGAEYPHIFARFPDVQFYDYTKLPNRRVDGIGNYHLTFSLADGNERASELALSRGLSVAVVLRDPERPTRRALDLPPTFRGVPLVSGDESDLRFLDPPAVYVGLRAKGRAVRDTTGFVHDLDCTDALQLAA